MKVALLVDHPLRDLPSATLVAVEICRRGHTVFLTPVARMKSELWALAPDFVLFYNLRHGREPMVRALLEAGVRIGVLDTEGGVFTNLEQYTGKALRHPDICRRISCFCAWGPRLASWAGENWLPPERVFVTGTPRTDFYVEPWRSVALRLSPWAGTVRPPLVLINGNFSVGNRLWGPRQDAPAADVAVEQRGMAEFARLANRLAAALPDISFVYRPHPFEREEPYRTLLEQRPNLHLIKTGTVEGWILRSSAVIQRGCTTAIEAGLAGVPALSPAWIPARLEIEAVEAVSLPCPSENHLLDRVRAAAAGELTVPPAVAESLDAIVAGWFHAVDGKAHQRVAEVILDCLGEGSQVSLRRSEQEMDGRGFRGRLRTRARRLAGLPVGWSFRQWRDGGSANWYPPDAGATQLFGAAEVQAIVDGLGAHEVTVRPARPDYHFGYTGDASVTLR